MKLDNILVLVLVGVVTTIIADVIIAKYQSNKSTGLLTQDDKHSAYYEFLGNLGNINSYEQLKNY